MPSTGKVFEADFLTPVRAHWRLRISLNCSGVLGFLQLLSTKEAVARSLYYNINLVRQGHDNSTKDVLDTLPMEALLLYEGNILHDTK